MTDRPTTTGNPADRPAPAARAARPAAKRGSSTPQRILSAGLAGAACVGVVGLLGMRMVQAQEADQAPADAAATAAQEPTTTTGLTQADLDAYAAALRDQKLRLDAYQADLVTAAKQLRRQAAQLADGSGVRVIAPRQEVTVAAPRQQSFSLQAAPAPQVAPQSNTKGS